MKSCQCPRMPRKAVIAIALTVVGLVLGTIAYATTPRWWPDRRSPIARTHWAWCWRCLPRLSATPPTTTASPTATTAAASTTTSTTPTTASSPTPGSAPAQPDGPAGSWTPAFTDNFNESSLNTSLWDPVQWHITNTTSEPYNVSVTGGNLRLELSDSSHGAAVNSYVSSTDPPDGFAVRVGDYVEASINFPGTRAGRIYNWSGFWLSGPNWPADGESDIDETLDGQLTINYHSPAGTDNTGPVPGDRANAYHTYGVYRGASFCSVYYDGKLVRTYKTSDDGKPESILFSTGYSDDGAPAAFGAASYVKVNWVRAWAPATASATRSG
jgi:hypothetical protein